MQSCDGGVPVSVVVVLGNGTVSEEVVLEGERAVLRKGKFVYLARLAKAVNVYKSLTRCEIATRRPDSAAPPSTILLAKTYVSNEGELGAHQTDLTQMLRRDPGFLQQEETQTELRAFAELLTQRDRLWAGGSDSVIQTWRNGDNTHDTMTEAAGCRWLLEQKFEHRLLDPAFKVHVVVVTSACHAARTRWIFDCVFEDALWAVVMHDASDTTATEVKENRLNKEVEIWAKQRKLIAEAGGFKAFMNAAFDPSGSHHDGRAFRFQFVEHGEHEAALLRSRYRVSFRDE